MRPLRRPLVAAALALAVALCGGVAWGQGAGTVAARSARPYAMLLFDSSGSMEWSMTGKALPICSSPTFERSRYLSAVEVLTGTFQGYSCVHEPRTGFTAGYYIPHVKQSFVSQDEDGLLDLYVDRIQFGLMTLDSFPNPSTGPDGAWSYPGPGGAMAPRHLPYMLPSGEATQAVEWRAGQCWYHWNTGARRKDVGWPNRTEAFDGALIGIWTDDYGTTTGNHRLINAQVQSELLNRVEPYWNSPVASLIEDVGYYYQNDEHMKAKNAGGRDCFFDCRDRHAILITDGIPNNDGQPKCAPPKVAPNNKGCPYPSPEEVAAQLHADGVKLHVIGYGMTGEVATDGREGKQVAWDIGLAGWGGVESDCPEIDPIMAKSNPITGSGYFCAYYADDPIALRDALSDVFDQIVEDANSMTRSATVNKWITAEAAMGQFQFFSSLQVSPGGPWEGNLERVMYKCEKAGPSWNIVRQDEVLDYGDEVLDLTVPIANDFGSRPLYTVLPSAGAAPAAAGAKTFIRLDAAIPPTEFGLLAGETAVRDDILNWMHGTAGSPRQDRRLGAIYHTSPVIIGPPSLELPLASYNVGPHQSAGQVYADIGFRQLYGSRPQIIYSASTEGILHAFEVDSYAANPTPRELWGFVPPMLLDRLRLQTLGESFLLDGHMAAQDVRIFKPSSGVGNEKWATILVMGLRQGGGQRGYFALDVTAPFVGEAAPAKGAVVGSMPLPANPNPSLSAPGTGSYGQPKLLWQITPETPTVGAYGFGPRPAFYDGIGYAYARPAFGTLSLPPPAPQGELGVVILSAGRRPVNDEVWCFDEESGVGAGDDPDCATTAIDPTRVGCGIYIVNAEDGSFIRWLAPTGMCNISGGAVSCSQDCQFTGTPLALGSLPGDVTSRIFVGDHVGRLWRADLSDANPNNWRMDLFFDFEVPEPIYEPPAAARDDRGLVTLLVGTGDPDNLMSRSLNRIASITETFYFNAAGVPAGPLCPTSWSQVAAGYAVAPENIVPGYCLGAYGIFALTNWVMNLNNPLGERLLGPAAIFNDTAYFASFVPGPDPDDCCVLGSSRIYGIHFTGDTPGATNDLFRVDNAGAAQPIVVQNLPLGEITYGVSIVRRPSCFEFTDAAVTDWDGNAFARLGQSQPPEYSLVLHNNAPATAPTGSEEQPQTGYTEITLEAPPLECSPDTWSFM